MTNIYRKTLINICVGVGGFILLIAILSFARNVNALDRACNANNNQQSNWDCNIAVSSAVNFDITNLKYKKTSKTSYSVSDEEYTGWLALDKENFKAMTEYSYNDPGGGQDLTGNGYTYDGGPDGVGAGCDAWYYLWSGTFDQKTFYWRQEEVSCGGSSPTFQFYEYVYFANNPGSYTLYVNNAHRSQVHTRDDSTNYAWKYYLHRQNSYDIVDNEIALYAKNHDTYDYATVKSSENAAGNPLAPSGGISGWTPGCNYGLSSIAAIVNINNHAGYSDSTWWFSDTDENPENTLDDFWWANGYTETSPYTASFEAGISVNIFNWPD